MRSSGRAGRSSASKRRASPRSGCTRSRSCGSLFVRSGVRILHYGRRFALTLRRMRPEPIWRPGEERMRRALITRYAGWLARTRVLELPTYEALWRWSVDDLEGFWGSLWEYFEVDASEPYERVLGSRAMPGAEWF